MNYNGMTVIIMAMDILWCGKTNLFISLEVEEKFTTKEKYGSFAKTFFKF